MEKIPYFTKLYSFQDKVLKIINQLDTDFYLTGGTASSRGYLNHRFSDDLDLFVNDDDRFGLWTERFVHALSDSKEWALNVVQKESRFVRLSLIERETTLKIEFINDAPSHIGNIRTHDLLGKIDSPENILANKVRAVIDRQEPKDLADIWGFRFKMGLSLKVALSDAHSKAAGIFPADLARVICSVSKKDWEAIRWIDPPKVEDFINELRKVGESLIF
ncbi:MAG: nucleotidyl transferase AbiEii/AbiGii toxin family protein [Nitrospiria bacterium]